MVRKTAVAPGDDSQHESDAPALELITTPAELAAQPVTDPVTVQPVLKALVDASDADIPTPPQPVDDDVLGETVPASTSASPSRPQARRVHPRRVLAAAPELVVHYVPAGAEVWRKFAGETMAFCSTTESPRAVFVDPLSVHPEVTPEIDKVTCVDCILSIATANIVRHWSQRQDSGFDTQLSEIPGYHAAPAVEAPHATTGSHAA